MTAAPAASRVTVALVELVAAAARADWMDAAECAQQAPDTFFPDKGAWQANRDARRVCQGCEVRPECLAYALRNREPFGIWGGLSARERNALRRQLARGGAPAPAAPDAA